MLNKNNVSANLSVDAASCDVLRLALGATINLTFSNFTDGKQLLLEIEKNNAFELKINNKIVVSAAEKGILGRALTMRGTTLGWWKHCKFEVL